MTELISETQRRICDKFGLPAQAPEPMVALAIVSLAQSPIYGTRIALPENGTISWFIHCGEHDDASGFTSPCMRTTCTNCCRRWSITWPCPAAPSSFSTGKGMKTCGWKSNFLTGKIVVDVDK